jgi:predicted enzyme related to lactoylglutathione lyase
MTTRETRWPAGTPNWADISVPDTDTALAFYGSVLGWMFHDTGEDFGHYHIAMVGERSVAGIGPSMAAEQPTAWLVYLASDDADATAKAISENGGRLLVEPFDVGEVCRLVIAQDNTGGAFGVFQPNTSIGLEVVDEPGALVWEDARLTDVAAGREFYTAVFGYRYSEIPGMALDQYGTFGTGDRPWGGMGGMWGAPEGMPSHWLPYFTVADVDAAARAARDGGGGVGQRPENTPFGRIGVLTDPFGAQFGVHGPTTG